MSSDVKVVFANLNYSFIKFNEQVKTLCQEVSEADKKDIYKSFKKIKSFIYEYLSYVRENNIRTQIINILNNINKQILDDEDYKHLSNSKDLNNMIFFNQRYYNYYISLFKLIGIFGDELSATFMPNKTDREKLFKYTNNNPFFENFTFYKSNLSQKLGDFSIFNFKDSFDYLIGFYYAYYTFIDEQSRILIEKTFSNILGIVLDDNILGLIITGYKNLSEDNKIFIRSIDNKLHDAALNIFFRCNYSYSLYGIMPRMENKVIIDKTTM
jgi:hypothetical protein